MTITMGQALAATRVRLDESTATAWTDVELRGWINEAVAEISRRTESLETVATITVTAATSLVDLPTNILRVSRLEWWVDSDGTRVYPLEIREKFAMDAIWAGGQKMTQGTPQYAALQGFPPSLKAEIYPLPGADGELHVTYYASPAPLATDTSADSSMLTIPTGWEDLIYDYATQAAQRRDANPAWQDTRQVFESKLQQMWDMVQFFHNQPGEFTQDPHGWEPEYWSW